MEEDIESCYNALLLYGYQPHLRWQELIASWTDEQRKQVTEWAWLEHTSANDNDVIRLPQPAFVPRMSTWDGAVNWS